MGWRCRAASSYRLLEGSPIEFKLEPKAWDWARLTLSQGTSMPCGSSSACKGSKGKRIWLFAGKKNRPAWLRHSEHGETCCEIRLAGLVDLGIQGRNMDLISIAWKTIKSFFKCLYWSIIALQWCVSFCCITKWISYTYTYILKSPPSWVSLPPSLSHPSRWSQSTKLISLCYVAASH